MATVPVPETARRRLRSAQARHADGDIAGALSEARGALELAPDFADARSYLGSTLITRAGRYEEGLAELERAREAAPDDAAIAYTLGWCYEFVAHRVGRRPRPGLEPATLYEKAEGYLRRSLELHPDEGMRNDAKDLLSSIIRKDVP